MEISAKSFTEKSGVKPSTKNAWARLVRRRWRDNPLANIMRDWPWLSEGQARGILYAQASQSTIDAVLDGLPAQESFALGLTILEIKTQMGLESFIERQAEEARRERIEWEAAERSAENTRARLAELRRVAG